ncbi:MAG: ABC transporter permease [Campylobacterota bacterium]|nr:ABC transporter permease [Campylobacterota bacterium]
MKENSLILNIADSKLSIDFFGEFNLYNISNYEKQINQVNFSKIKILYLNFSKLTFLDSAAAIYIDSLEKQLLSKNIVVEIICSNNIIFDTLKLVKGEKKDSHIPLDNRSENILIKTGKLAYSNYLGFISFIAFMGEMFATKFHYLRSYKNIRFKEIAYELNDSMVKAFGIIALTSFLIGLVVAYQSAYQLKLYGANIFIVDMLGISIFRELAPLITAIVIAGRSGSAFTAQIGAMKITQELDAMRTMGFDPYKFLVIPKIIALMIAMPILIFLADMMGILGGMVVANIDLDITTELFLDRFSEVVAVKHFFIGIIKGPFFAFLIASIAIYRGLMVKNDTQSIGVNTTKSVVEAIFAVIVCDAIFSIAFTNLGI